MKHIVKFNQASDANNYEIKNVPFITTVGENNQLLTCNQENKKIVIDGQGNASLLIVNRLLCVIHKLLMVIGSRIMLKLNLKKE